MIFVDASAMISMMAGETDVAAGHGTIEWMFGGKDVGVFKTGKPFEVQGVSVIEIRGNRISHNLDHYDAATIMKQVGKLPTPD